MSTASILARTAALSGLLVALSFPAQAQAQTHDGDVEMSIVSGTITLDGHAAVRAGNGFQIFEGDFGDVAGGPFKTDDPGYDSEAGTWASGAIVNYQILGVLEFWNGSSWAPAGLERVTLEGNLGEASFIQGSGVSGDLTGLIGQSGSNGVIHEHLDMGVSRIGGGLPSVGAYLIQLQLTSVGLQSSQPYYIALNRGLSEIDFESAVQALAVPEPGTWALLAGGLLAVLRIARRRA